MHLVPCYCNAYVVDADNATYVNNFKPMCHEETCKKVKAQREHNADYRQIVGQDCDRMPREIYSDSCV